MSQAAQWWTTCLPMQEMQVWSLGQEDPLEEEMAIHSSILVWEIPWTGEPSGLQSVGLQSRHDWACMYRHQTEIAQVWSPCFATNINSTWPWSNCSNFIGIIFPTAFAHFVSHFGKSNNISNSVIILTFVNVIFDVTVAKRLQLSKGSDDG